MIGASGVDLLHEVPLEARAVLLARSFEVFPRQNGCAGLMSFFDHRPRVIQSKEEKDMQRALMSIDDSHGGSRFLTCLLIGQRTRQLVACFPAKSTADLIIIACQEFAAGELVFERRSTVAKAALGESELLGLLPDQATLPLPGTDVLANTGPVEAPEARC